MDQKMFCYRCEQTAGCAGCTGSAGVCGKTAETANTGTYGTPEPVSVPLMVENYGIGPLTTPEEDMNALLGE